MRKKFKNFVTGLSMALSSVEKNALKPTDEFMSTDVTKNQRHSQGTLADALINGEVTQEVENLRWRTAKVFDESSKIKIQFTGEYDDKGHPIYTKAYRDIKFIPSKIKTDPYDTYPVEMVITNREITKGIGDILSTMSKSELTTVTGEEQIGDDIITKYASITKAEGLVKLDESNKIYVERSSLSTFNFEAHILKIIVRTISETEKLLDCYISTLPNSTISTSKSFLNEINKIKGGKLTHIFNVDKLGFITENDIGVYNELIYEYDNIKLDKIVDFNGYHVIKLKANVLMDGIYVNDKHRLKRIDDKYDERHKKNIQ